MRARSKRLWDTWQEWRARPSSAESMGGSPAEAEKDPRPVEETRKSDPPALVVLGFIALGKLTLLMLAVVALASLAQ